MKLKKKNLVSQLLCLGIFIAGPLLQKDLTKPKYYRGYLQKEDLISSIVKKIRWIYAIEVGAQISAFPGKIPIMASSDNKTIFYKAKKRCNVCR
jgi:hypothetical protein